MFANIKRGLYHYGDSCSDVLNKINIISCADLWGINARERLFLFGGFTELCIYIDVSFNIKRDFYYLGVVFGIMLYIYMYLLILKEAFIIWGIQGIMYLPIYIMYLSILKEAFIIWGVVFGIMYICIF